jgi:hypothetical protein
MNNYRTRVRKTPELFADEAQKKARNRGTSSLPMSGGLGSRYTVLSRQLDNAAWPPA